MKQIGNGARTATQMLDMEWLKCECPQWSYAIKLSLCRRSFLPYQNMSFHGILVADELICHNFWTNDAILTQLGRIHLREAPHPWISYRLYRHIQGCGTSRRWILPSCVKIASFVQKLRQISSSDTRMPWNDTFKKCFARTPKCVPDWKINIAGKPLVLCGH